MADRSRMLWSLALISCVVLPLAGCTSLQLSTPTRPSWEDRTREMLHDPDGLGDGSGGVPGGVQLVLPAKQRHWVIYAACTGTDSLHLTVHGGAARAGETDITCGKTTRMPLTIASDANVSFTVDNPDRYDAHALWYASINTSSWKQAPTTEG